MISRMFTRVVCLVAGLVVFGTSAAEFADEAAVEAALGARLALWLDASQAASLDEYAYNGHTVPAETFGGGRVIRKWCDRRATQQAVYALNGRAELSGQSNAGFVRTMPYTIPQALNGRDVLSFGAFNRSVSGAANMITPAGAAATASATESRRLIFNAPLACATAVMVVGTQEGGGYSLLGGCQNATGEGYYLRAGETFKPSLVPAVVSRASATDASAPIFSQAVPCRVNGQPVDPTTVGFNGDYQVVSFDLSAAGTAQPVGALGMRDAYQNAGGVRYGEILLFDQQLSPDERAAVESYLMRKWGISAAPDDRDVEPAVTICCVGDSITQGGSAFVASRVALEKVLSDAGWKVAWRGSHVTPESGSTQPHEGWSGKTAEQVAEIYAAHAADDRADILLLHAGHNHDATTEQPIPGILAAHRKIIAAARAQNPDVLVFDACVITSGKLPKYSYIPALNAEIRALCAELSTDRSPVVAVDMAEGWDWMVDTVADKVHPSADGAAKMAAKWFAALQASPVKGANEVLLEAEAFADFGGWSHDTQFVELMGSPYLLAHGLGQPVADAVGSFRCEATGTVRLWVRTRDWTPDYAGEKPGRFRVDVNGRAGQTVLGVAPADWSWVDAGVWPVSRGANEVRLVDLTGFEGRCDALYFTSDLAADPPPSGGAALSAWRARMRGEDVVPEATRAFDLVVVGGGIAGTCAAVAAAEEGLSVALVQDRPFLGGNASGEIRVHVEGEQRHRIVGAVGNTEPNGDPYAHVDDTNRLAYVSAFTNLAVYTGWRAYGVVTNAARRLTAVDARETSTGERLRLTAPLFCDATGDGWIGYWAGAAYRVGREAKSEYNETMCGQDVADGSTMGNSMLWRSAVADTPRPFPAVPWAMAVAGTSAKTSGDWTWEAGLGPDEDTIWDAEMLRDRLFRAVYGNFANAKKQAAHANRYLEWVPFNAGKRESRRILGDYVVRESDVVNTVVFEDTIGTATWTIDLHFYADDSGYRCSTKHVRVPRWYMPYRSLCCRDIPNLFLAGRCASYTHVAMGSSRVMRTGGQQGVAVGYAAALCRKYACEPREIYCDPRKTTELQKLIGGPWPMTVKTFPDDVIVDNADATGVEISGAWTVSSYNADRHGPDYLHNAKKASDDLWVRFTPEIPSNATYRVYLVWNMSNERGTAVPVEIVHAQGTVTNTVDMTQSANGWTALGDFPFARGSSGSVRVLTTGQSGLTVIADAVRFSPHLDEAALDSDGNGLPDAWERRHFLQATGTDPNGDADGDGLSNLGEYLAGTDPNNAQDYFAFKNCTADRTQVTLTWPCTPGRVYNVWRAPSLDGKFVLYRQNVPAATNAPENTLQLPSDDAPSAFYRVQIVR